MKIYNLGKSLEMETKIQILKRLCVS